MIPEVIFFHESLPLSSSGRSRQKALEKLFVHWWPVEKAHVTVVSITGCALV